MKRSYNPNDVFRDGEGNVYIVLSRKFRMNIGSRVYDRIFVMWHDGTIKRSDPEMFDDERIIKDESAC